MTLNKTDVWFALCLAAAIAVPAGQARAGDWIIRTGLVETLSANDNFDFAKDPDGYVFGSYSELSLDAQAHSHVYDFLLNGALGYQTYFGDAGDIPGDRLAPRVQASYVRRGKTTDVTFGAAYALEPATTGNDLVVDNIDNAGDRQTFSANMSVAHKVNARNDVTLAVHAAAIDFIDAAPTDISNTSYGGSVSWRHRATKLTDFSLSSTVDWYNYESIDNLDKYYYVLRGGMNTQLSKRLSVSAGVGGTLTESIVDPVLPQVDRVHDTTLGLLADGSFSYLLKSGNLTGAVSYGVTPDDNGDLTNALNFSSAISHRVNDMTELRLGAQYRLEDSAVDGNLANTTFSISPGLSYTLARDWLLGASYQFAVTDDEDGRSFQNSMYLTLSRSYVLLP